MTNPQNGQRADPAAESTYNFDGFWSIPVLLLVGGPVGYSVVEVLSDGLPDVLVMLAALAAGLTSGSSLGFAFDGAIAHVRGGRQAVLRAAGRGLLFGFCGGLFGAVILGGMIAGIMYIVSPQDFFGNNP